ncbi:hypothetical protein M3148_16745 [Georgenia satyanarayanai]|uniref:hypothetical protein n=1 Tax=Georgenia satyanarayanai TaxID=860221 RepID=UPI00204112FC|nr:hypothetical protein [Georgenia satyanarayanai]MCM3662623.1 hypothetical protein [Georgenia satyanarayanai]
MCDRHAVLLSVRPRFAAAIMDGTKTVELRRTRMHVREGTTVLLYSSSPTRSVLATAVLDGIEEGAPRSLWSRFKKVVGVTRDELDDYFYGTSQGYALKLRDVVVLEDPFPLEEMRRQVGLEPPQSFRYVSARQAELLTRADGEMHSADCSSYVDIGSADHARDLSGVGAGG